MSDYRDDFEPHEFINDPDMPNELKIIFLEDWKEKQKRNGNGLYQNHRGHLRQKPAPDNAEPIKLRFFDQLTDAKPKPWLIKNVIAAGEVSSWIGAPGAGKSCLLTDAAVHLASQRQWRGYRVKGGGCVYFALEKAILVERRLIAYRGRDGLEWLPIAIAGQIIDLMDRSCVGLIVDALKQAEDRFGIRVMLAIFDTWSKGIAAGGGDENHARDQNIAAANLRRVIDQRDHELHIATIGHTGKDESKGERGSNAKLADVDLEVQISGEEVKTATVTKANDQDLTELTSFKLEPFEFGEDEDGDPVRTFIVSQESIAGVAAPKRRLSDRQLLGLRALANCDDQPVQPWVGTPQVVRAVALEVWRKQLYATGVLDCDAASPREDFRRLLNQLAAKNLICVMGNWVWKVVQ